LVDTEFKFIFTRMDILSYLTTLIKTHKEVGVPGLGTIYKKKSPGRYDTETHSFLPPSYTLSFTSDLKEQELLTGIISKKKNISTDAATYFVEQFSQNILDELSNQQESDFGDLGTFSTTSGSLTFIPKQDQNFGFDFFGLPALEDKLTLDQETKELTTEETQIQETNLVATELPQEELLKVEEEPQVTREQLELENNNADLSDGAEVMEDEIAEISEAEQPKVFEPMDPVNTAYDTTLQEEKKGMPAYLKAIIALLVVAGIAGIAYVTKPELFTGTAIHPIPKQDTLSNIRNDEQPMTDSIVRADSIRLSNEKAIMAIDSAKGSAVIPHIEPSADTTISYDIIAASLLNKKEADQFLADMKTRGIPAKISKMRGKRIKISIGSFLNEDSAKKELEMLKKTTKIPGIYITPIRHTNNPK
jgi:hypothetical protein